MDQEGYSDRRRFLPLMGTPFRNGYYPFAQIGKDGGKTDFYSSLIPGPLLQLTTSYRGPRSEVPETADPLWLIANTNRKFWHQYDTGHHFRTEKESAVFGASPLTGVGGGVSLTGIFMANDASSYLGRGKFGTSSPVPSYRPSPIDLGVGTQFLNSLRPTKSAANLAQALIELFLDLPRLPFEALIEAKRLTDTLKKGSSEYLNAVFGWAPIVSDIQKIVNAVANVTKIINQFERDSGKQIRRRAARPWTQQSDTVVSQTTGIGTTFGEGSGYYGSRIFTSSFNARGASTVSERYTEKYAFSGAFMYLLAGEETFLDQMNRYGQLANKLLGIRLNLEVLWEIAPWSWLADWFSNVGSFIGLNTSIADDNLVIKYGYLMREVVYHRTFSHTGIKFRNGFSTGPRSLTYSYRSKERVGSTPYGFGLNPGSFSDYQWSILAALGLSRSGRKL